MNYLAHFHLAWPDPGLVVGGLEGDYYKGPLRGDLPGDIESGVRLHRAIDAYMHWNRWTVRAPALRVAVLPFQTLGPDEQRPLGDRAVLEAGGCRMEYRREP